MMERFWWGSDGEKAIKIVSPDVCHIKQTCKGDVDVKDK